MMPFQLIRPELPVSLLPDTVQLELPIRGIEGAVLPMMSTSIEFGETLISGMVTILLAPQSLLWIRVLLRIVSPFACSTLAPCTCEVRMKLFSMTMSW